MDFFSIASGSSGNCICVGDDSTHVMIDAGISGKLEYVIRRIILSSIAESARISDIKN